jgi:hypothetical protein
MKTVLWVVSGNTPQSEKTTAAAMKHRTHLCLVIHYWNGSYVAVINIVLRARSSPSLIAHPCLPPEGVSHCCRYLRAGSLSKSDVNFLQRF